jgi:hypothetical protein
MRVNLASLKLGSHGALEGLWTDSNVYATVWPDTTVVSFINSSCNGDVTSSGCTIPNGDRNYYLEEVEKCDLF